MTRILNKILKMEDSLSQTATIQREKVMSFVKKKRNAGLMRIMKDIIMLESLLHQVYKFDYNNE